jgi:hypothetical protein
MTIQRTNLGRGSGSGAGPEALAPAPEAIGAGAGGPAPGVIAADEGWFSPPEFEEESGIQGLLADW